MEEGPRISLAEGILMVTITATADLFEIIATLTEPIPVIGQILYIIKCFTNILNWIIIQFWLIMKGIRGLWFLGGSLIDIVANLLALDIPFGKTITLLLTIYLVNHPKTKVIKVAKIAGQITKMAPEK
jgi:hypothetical protein